MVGASISIAACLSRLTLAVPESLAVTVNFSVCSEVRASSIRGTSISSRLFGSLVVSVSTMSE
jgi:hypothetical protein